MRVDAATVANIGIGYVLLVGIESGDTPADIKVAADKIFGLRVFADETGKMARSITDVGGAILVVSQFTLLGDVQKGRRPSFTRAAAPEVAAPLVEEFVDAFRQGGVETFTGVFGASMEVDIVNDGPVTLVLAIRNAKLD